MIVWRDEKGQIVDVTGSVNHAELARLKEEHGEVGLDKAKGAITPETKAPFQSIDELLKEQGLPPQQSLEDVFKEAHAKLPPPQDPQAPAPQAGLDEPAEESPEAEAEEETEEVDVPSASDLKADWVDFAVSQGLDREEAEGYTKQELVDQFGG